MNRTTAAGSVDGAYVDDDPVNEITGTLLVAKDRNALQEEIMAVIEAAGITPDGNNFAQLLAALRSSAANLVDANKLNGQLAAYYRDASNLNAGTVAQERLPLAAIAAAINYTADDVLAKYKTVDGLGSGADTDLVRGTTPGAGGLALLAMSVLGTGWTTLLAANKPTTLGGYGITDALGTTEQAVDSAKLAGIQSVSYARSCPDASFDVAWWCARDNRATGTDKWTKFAEVTLTGTWKFATVEFEVAVRVGISHTGVMLNTDGSGALAAPSSFHVLKLSGGIPCALTVSGNTVSFWSTTPAYDRMDVRIISAPLEHGNIIKITDVIQDSPPYPRIVANVLGNGGLPNYSDETVGADWPALLTAAKPTTLSGFGITNALVYTPMVAGTARNFYSKDNGGSVGMRGDVISFQAQGNGTMRLQFDAWDTNLTTTLYKNGSSIQSWANTNGVKNYTITFNHLDKIRLTVTGGTMQGIRWLYLQDDGAASGFFFDSMVQRLTAFGGLPD